MKHPLLTTLATAAFLALTATAAEANSYEVYACSAGVNTFRNPNASTTAWVKDVSAAGGHFAQGNGCGTSSTGGSMYVVSVTGDLASRGQNGEWRFQAPTGLTVASAKFWRRAWTYGTGTAGSSQRNFLTVMAGGSPFYSDSDGGSDAPYGSRGTGDLTDRGIVDANLLSLNLAAQGAGTISYRVGCGFDAGCPTASASGPAPNYFASGVELFGAVVAVNDSIDPTVAVADSGLFGAGDVSGVRPAIVQSASDASGIKKLAVFADGATNPVGVLDFEQDVNWCNWAASAPCQNVTDTEIPVDTRQLADGQHSFVVKAYDAAGNEKASTTRYATIKNSMSDGTTTPTTSPTDPSNSTTPEAGLPNGIDQSANAGTTSTAAAPKLIVTFDQNGKSKLAAKYGRMIMVRGHLTDGHGGPIINAEIRYSALSTRAGARVQNLGAVRTDSSGTFTLNVATKLGSRQLRFAYSLQLGGPTATTAQATLDVAAPINLKVTPKRTRNKHRVTFSGKLGAGPIPRKGKLVSLQVVVDGRWHTFAVVRSSRSGRFKYRYRFKRTYGRVTYRFRALSRYEAAYPFVAGHSKTVRLRVN